jgi:pimeloyl-ACP methyl ester carboxylesterase
MIALHKLWQTNTCRGEEMIAYRTIRGVRIACWLSSEPWDTARKHIVFIHGSGGDHTVWSRQFPKLKDEWNVTAIELPGHGRSEGAGEQDVPAYVEWVREILEAFAIPKPIMAGHSLGAAIALAFAIKYPGLLSGIIPVGGGAKMPVNQAILDGLKTNPASVIEMIVKFSLTKNNREHIGGPLRESLLKANAEILYGDLVACDKQDITAEIAGITIPVLVICGDDDKMTPPDFSRFLADHIPGARISLIENAGHFVMLENPEAVNRVVSDFSAHI